MDSPYQSLLNTMTKHHKAMGEYLPPVGQWHPALSGLMDIRIAADGTWYHEGDAIQRLSLVKLFSSILKREGDEYFLVTPIEKWQIRVDEVPFVAVILEVVGKGSSNQALVFTCITGDIAIAGKDHPIRVEIDAVTGEPSPYILLRSNLEAKICRSAYYQLAELAVPSGEDAYTVSSQGEQFQFQ
ncbi:MAG: DUF1285 domain-containing protein [Porticoccus sp.]|nr:DUF1285 domain-containing protein [Porticoccus sp.]